VATEWCPWGADAGMHVSPMSVRAFQVLLFGRCLSGPKFRHLVFQRHLTKSGHPCTGHTGWLGGVSGVSPLLVHRHSGNPSLHPAYVAPSSCICRNGRHCCVVYCVSSWSVHLGKKTSTMGHPRCAILCGLCMLLISSRGVLCAVSREKNPVSSFQGKFVLFQLSLLSSLLSPQRATR
jgi:hypothetical protein